MQSSRDSLGVVEKMMQKEKGSMQLAPVHGHDRHFTELYKVVAHRKLKAVPADTTRPIALLRRS